MSFKSATQPLVISMYKFSFILNDPVELLRNKTVFRQSESRNLWLSRRAPQNETKKLSDWLVKLVMMFTLFQPEV